MVATSPEEYSTPMFWKHKWKSIIGTQANLSYFRHLVGYCRISMLIRWNGIGNMVAQEHLEHLDIIFDAYHTHSPIDILKRLFNQK